MNLYESIKNYIKESDTIHCRHCGEALEELDFDNDKNDFNESDSKEERENPCLVYVYDYRVDIDKDNKATIWKDGKIVKTIEIPKDEEYVRNYLLDALREDNINESDESKQDRIKWLENALSSIYSYGIRSCVIDKIVPGLTNKDSYGSLSDEYKELTGKDFNIKDHIVKESEEGERVDLFLRNDYGDWVDYLWYYPSSGKFFATFETVSHAEAWKRLNDPQVKQAVKDSWGDDTEKVYKEMIDYLKSCDDLKESELKESYDLVNVVEDTQSAIKNLINNLQKNGDTVQTSIVIDALNSILKDIEKNSEEAW